MAKSWKDKGKKGKAKAIAKHGSKSAWKKAKGKAQAHKSKSSAPKSSGGVKGINNKHLGTSWKNLGQKQKSKLKSVHGSNAKSTFKTARKAQTRSSGGGRPSSGGVTNKSPLNQGGMENYGGGGGQWSDDFVQYEEEMQGGPMMGPLPEQRAGFDPFEYMNNLRATQKDYGFSTQSLR